jgi:hypothetical protein
MVFVMLNPSWADEVMGDPTITRCMKFARREGCTSVAAVNLAAWVGTEPRALHRAHQEGTDVVGPANDHMIRQECAGRPLETPPLVVVAWGYNVDKWPWARDRAVAVTRLLTSAGVQLHCLGVTKSGEPVHPVRLRQDAPLVQWRPVSREVRV